jgi:protein SCO1/2
MLERRAEACNALPGACSGGWRTWLVLPLLSLLAACTAADSPTDSPPAFYATEVSGIDYGRSLVLNDSQGQPRRLEDFRDQIVIVFFGFTSCPDVCPTTLMRLRQAQQALGEDAERLQVLLITVDPERDTAERLQAYVNNFGSAFIGLRPAPEELDRVVAEFRAIAVRVPSADGSDYTIDHSATLYVYDRRNRLRLLAQPPLDFEAFTADLRRLVREET